MAVSTEDNQTTLNDAACSQPHREQHKRLIKREGTTGGKLPLLHWRNSKLWRYLSQTLFMLINLYIGVTFYYWVRFYETMGQSTYIERPSGIEGWLPIAGLMNIKFTLLTQQIPPIYAASMLLLCAFMLISFLFKRSFCSWFCPIGTLSELAWKLGQRLFGRNVTLPKWIDIPLRSLKYLLLGVVIYFIIPLSAFDVMAFLQSPYGIIIDVKMLDFFRYMGQTTLIVLSVLTLMSLFVQNAWCRYLCPYGALMGIVSSFSPLKIRRDPDACIDCNRCAKACPAKLPVDRLIAVRSIECTTCMTCVEICPAQDALQLALAPRNNSAINGDAQGLAKRWHKRKVAGVAVILIIYGILIGTISYAKYNNVWDSPVSPMYYARLIPKADMFGHP